MEPQTPASDSPAADPVAQYQHAAALHYAGRLDEAAALYRQMLAQFPGNPLLMTGLGVIALQQGRVDEGIAQLDASLRIEPAQPMALSNLGMALRGLKRLDEALACLDQAVALAPDFAEAFNHRGVVLHSLKRPDEALASYDRAIALDPSFAQAHNNRGVALQDMNRLYEALSSFDRALALNPLAADVHSNRSRVLRDLGRLEESLAACDRAIELDPEYAPAYLNKSILLLLWGRYEEGWALYEWRWKDPDCTPSRIFPRPLWLGDQPIAGKTLLVHPEQGLGDFIEFCRYVPMLEAMGAKVVLETYRSLVPLISTLKGNFVLVPTGEPLPSFDVHCPIMSLPLACRTTLETVPGATPYLYADPERLQRWQQRLGPKARMRVGLAWSGNPGHKNDMSRSIAFRQLAPLLALPVDFHVLQRDIRPGDAEELARWPSVQVHSAELGDFADTAALATEMDLVVSVCTSIAHLAGALARPLWLLLAFNPDYRWGRDRTDSPWYPTATLFRQPALNDWDTPISAMANQLRAMAGEANRNVGG